MGITYQTSNRLRRKVQTAPLPALPEGQPAAEVVAPAKGRRWALPALLAAAAAAVGAAATYLP